jgi:hypothetical protein
MTVQIRKAKRSASKMRLLLTGPSGAGKTWGGLKVAKGLGCQRVIVIDTEQGSSDLYESILPFDVIDLAPPFTPERYIEAIEAAEEAGADCIIIDSISHEWNGKGGCLELVDEIARAQFRGNTWSAYSVITPRHRAFIDRMLRSSAHIIATGRSKTETAQVEDGGRKKVAKLGMKVETRDGVEYEFTTVLDIVHDGHFALASKDRTGIFTDTDPKPITVATGKQLAAWLSCGTPAPVTSAPTSAKTAPAVQGPAPAERDDESTPFRRAADAIAAADTVARLGEIADGIDKLLSRGALTNDQAHDLTDEIEKRHNQIDSQTQEVANAI